MDTSQAYSPWEFREHRYGLPLDRWNRLSGRSYWVTGAGTGYGHSMAAGLAAAGAHVFMTGRRAAQLRESIAAIRSYGVPDGFCHAVPADLSDPAAIAHAAQVILTQCSSLYGLVNNAAVPQSGAVRFPLLDGTPESWDAMMATNLRAPWLVTRAVLPQMMMRGEGRILFMSSGAGWSFAAGFGPYNISKAALNSLVACVAEECRFAQPDIDIQVNALDPGQARTEMNQGSTASPFHIVTMALTLLSHPPGGPNGRFFHQDGRYLSFCSASPHTEPL